MQAVLVGVQCTYAAVLEYHARHVLVDVQRGPKQYKLYIYCVLAFKRRKQWSIKNKYLCVLTSPLELEFHAD